MLKILIYKLQRYLRIYRSFFRFSLMQTLEFRTNFLFRVILSVFWLLITLFMIDIIFQDVEAIAGWTKNEVYLLTITIRLAKDILAAFVIDGVKYAAESVERGGFDFILLKPINLRFFVSFFWIQFRDIPRILLSAVLFIYFANKVGTFPFLNWTLFLVLFSCSVITFYSIFYGMKALNFWLVRLWNLKDLHNQFMSIGRLPVYAYRGGWRFLFTYLIPAAFLATFPLEFLFGRGSWWKMVMGVFLMVVFYFGSGMVFNKGVKEYSSASS